MISRGIFAGHDNLVTRRGSRRIDFRGDRDVAEKNGEKTRGGKQYRPLFAGSPMTERYYESIALSKSAR